jgi:hypothetical protein
MSSRRFDSMADVEGAWARFRGRLADVIAGLEGDECFWFDLEVGIDDEDLPGAAPYVQFQAWGPDLVRGEVVSNAYLDERFRLTEPDQRLLLELGWTAPTHGRGDEQDSGSANFHLDVETREADRLAVMTVRALREVFGCAHPAFLDADELLDAYQGIPAVVPVPPAASVPAVAAVAGEEVATGSTSDTSELADEPATFPTNHEHLQELIDKALEAMFERPLTHDRDGDVRIVTGKSVIFVQVVDDRPAVDLYAEVVSDVRDLERAAEEVAILNGGRSSMRFYVRDDQVVMRFRIYAWPFSPTQLRVALADVRRDLDDIAPALATRVGGRLFLEQAPVEPEPDRAPVSSLPLRDLHPDPDDAHPAMIGLLELLLDGPVAPGVVATMFNGDAELLTSQIARVRSGAQSTGEHPPDTVAALLRKALRLVVEAKAAREAFGRSRSPVRRHSRQLALLPEPEDSPEAGLWSNDHLGETS